MTSLATRYGANTCNYYEYIVNLHSNWDIPRVAKMATVTSTIQNLKTTADDYQTNANSLKANLNSFKTTLDTNFNSLTNSQSGTFNGIDCRVIGESIWDLRDSVCIGFL